jgi:hypothetical protein
VSGAERPGDRVLALRQRGAGFEQLDLSAGSEMRAQREQGLESRYPAAGDDDPGHTGEPRSARRSRHPYGPPPLALVVRSNPQLK